MYEGISLYASPNNVVSDNIIVLSNIDGISLYFSNNNVFSGNIILNNHEGISLYRSSNNVFSGNTISNNQNGASIDYTSNRNTFSHNNFDDAVKMESGSTNIWNSGGEGNYWRNYNGTDSNGDGIGDKPFSIDSNNRDNAPLMGMFSNFNVVFTRETYQVTIISNSTVSSFGFEIGPETGNKIIRFNVAGEDGTVGFSRITIPTGLMNYSLIVFGEKEEIIPTELNKSSKTNVFLYFTYSHSNQTVAIISSNILNLYNELLEKHSKLSGDLYNLNVTYLDLLSNYTAFLDRYTQLQQDYLELNASYNLHLMDYSDVLQNFRSLMYIFAAATAVLIVSTVYISNRVHTRTIKVSEEKK
jgi:parallel beta-helix repeat protein